MARALCQSRTCRPEHRGGARQAEVGRAVCHRCAISFGGNINAIAAMWPDLQARLVPADSPNEKVSGSRTPGLVIDEAVSMVIDEVTDWAWFVARIVFDETNHVWRGYNSTPALLAWIVRWHNEHLMRHDDDELVIGLIDDAARYRSLVHRHAYPSGARRVEIPGQCPIVDDETGERCTGTLYAIVRSDASLLPSEIKCELDERHAIPSGQWATYGRKLRRST